MSRLVLAVGAFWFMGEVVDASPGDTEAIRSASFWAFWLFLIAAVSDFLDGWLARRNGWVTAFGRVADPVVDKVLTLGSLIYLCASSNLARDGDLLAVMPVWAVVLMLAREFLVTALRGLVESYGLSFGADRYGKLKLILQVVYIAIPLGVAGGIPHFLHLPFLELTRNPYLFAGMFVVMVGLTVVSGLNYCLRGARLLAETELK
ncbi:MAG: CDP-alcohol phosphatidyltransferase family protein [Planctomycetes bacterium]|nr:CDP-alcohol phosphatidyltransferase family protein [Planctomycetota bacterium]